MLCERQTLPHLVCPCVVRLRQDGLAVYVSVWACLARKVWACTVDRFNSLIVYDHMQDVSKPAPQAEEHHC